MRKKLKITASVFLIIALVFTVLAIIPLKKVIEKNPFVIEEGGRPLIAAHRGGKNLNPENTFKAINYSVDNFNIDIIEMDLCLTKDNVLILSHDSSLNKYTDCTLYQEEGLYYVKDHTLEEIQKLNFGYKFTDKDGNKLYENLLNGVSEENKSQVLLENELRVVTINELFEKYKNTNLLYIVEIKDDGQRGLDAADILINLMSSNNVTEKVVIGSFHDDVYNYIRENHKNVSRGGSVGAVTKFVVTQLLGVSVFDDSDFTCLQIPMTRKVSFIKLNLTWKTYINKAHRKNISVQYWTINDKEDMRNLIEKGCDVIMTDNPDILFELLKEMGFYD